MSVSLITILKSLGKYGQTPLSSVTAQLDPCPFCGGQAKAYWYTELQTFTAGCMDDACHVDPATSVSLRHIPDTAMAERRLISKWNQRA